MDLQTLKLQENPEDVPTGELPRNVLLSVDRHLVHTIVPGTRLTVVDIYNVFQASGTTKYVSEPTCIFVAWAFTEGQG